MANGVPSKLALPQVTLCAVSSVNVAATILALEASLSGIDFAACKLFTDVPVKPDYPGITVVPIARLASSQAYSDFLLSQMVDHIETSHCLIAQWDGHVLNAKRWRPEFLDYDYIGARWPQFDDGYDVGNGGFSLRSRKMMEACRHNDFRAFHPEDVAICRFNRNWLEDRGMRFAPNTLADLFSTERGGDPAGSFGYHGVWHMPGRIGVDAFWDVYRSLDDRGTVRHDFGHILRQVRKGQGGHSRAFRLIADYVRHVIKARVKAMIASPSMYAKRITTP